MSVNDREFAEMHDRYLDYQSGAREPEEAEYEEDENAGEGS
jgi:beta-galactosidase beta subunit